MFKWLGEIIPKRKQLARKGKKRSHGDNRIKSVNKQDVGKAFKIITLTIKSH